MVTTETHLGSDHNMFVVYSRKFSYRDALLLGYVPPPVEYYFTQVSREYRKTPPRVYCDTVINGLHFMQYTSS